MTKKDFKRLDKELNKVLAWMDFLMEAYSVEPSKIMLESVGTIGDIMGRNGILKERQKNG